VEETPDYSGINQKSVIASQVEKWANGENERIKGILILIITGYEIRIRALVSPEIFLVPKVSP
jgi:hypothetical protein